MSTVTCANCNSKNIEGSKFCNHCGAALPLSTHISCPNCETRNPRTLMYCDNCGTRLLPTGELSSEREEEKPPKPISREAPKAFSLPARDPGDELDPNQLLDWLRTGEENPEGESGQSAPQNLQEQGAAHEDVVGNWLDDLDDTEQESGDELPAEGGISDWLSELESLDDSDGETADTSIEDTFPNWLDELSLEDGPEASADETGEEVLADWFGDFEEEAETPELTDTDVLRPDLFGESQKVPTAEDFENTLKARSPFQDDEVVADWLSEFEEPLDPTPESEGRGLADWLDDPVEESDTPTFIESSVSADEEVEIPDWLTDFESEDVDDDMPTLISAAPSSEEDEIPDWLTEFETDADETPTMIEPAVSSDEDEDLGDWLSDFDTGEASPTLMAPTPSMEPQEDDTAFSDWLGEEAVEGEDEELPDWLGDFGSEADTPTLVGSFDSAEEDEAFPDWLSNIDDDQDGALVETADSTETTDDDELPDWLSDVDNGEEALGKTAVSFDAEDEGLPDWLSGVGEEEALVETAFSADDDEEELPDWLSDFGDEEDTPTLIGSSDPFEGDGTEDLPDWLSSMESNEEFVEPAAVDSDSDAVVEDWLADFDDEDESPTLIASSIPLAERDELTDWLSDFEDDSDDEDMAPAEAVLAEDSLPADWFEDFSDENDPILELEGTEDGEGALPDWLAEMASEEDETAITSDETDDFLATFNTAELAYVDELPDWLSEISPESEEEPAEAVSVDDLEADDDELPDWLSEIPDENETFDLDDDTDWLEALNQKEAWPEAVDDEEMAARLEPPEPEKETADPGKPSNELKGVPKELVSSGLPDWLQEDMPQMSSMDDEEQLAQGELPDWLQQMRPSGVSDSEELGLGEGLDMGDTQEEWQTIFANMPSADRGLRPDNSELSAAEIPAWLQALRPTVVGDDLEVPLSDEEPETEGPLAGLRGVLQVAPFITIPSAATTTPRYTASKEQQQQIALLHRLTHEEPEATKQVSVKKSATFSGGGRALLGILLFLVILAGILLPRTDIPLPETALPVSESAFATHNTIDPLTGAAVLVAFDYTPAMAAELDPIAEMLLRQLATNGNRVLTVSQSAAGTTIADRVTGEVVGLESQSLGLLTGEAVGLRSLGSCLNGGENCAMLFSDSMNAAVQNDLTNLGLVIILTSDQNSLINWIEQVESETEAPVIAAVTQPLGPLTIPYLSSGQLAGSLNGIPAASAYEKRLLGQDGGTFQQFTAQSISMWVVIIALIVAALFYGLSGFASRGEKKGNR